MGHREALKVLGCNVDCRQEDISWMYKQAAKKYHPDRNEAGLEMMKLINAARESLRDYIAGSLEREDMESQVDLGEVLNAALNAVVGLEGIVIEICGCWIWVSGDTKPHREVLKAAGYRYAPKKVMWSFCGGKRTSSRGKFSMDDIRLRHGSATVAQRKFARLQG